MGFVAVARETIIPHTIWKAPPANLLPVFPPCSIGLTRGQGLPRGAVERVGAGEGGGRRNFSHCTLLKKVFMSYNAPPTADCTALSSLPLSPFPRSSLVCLLSYCATSSIGLHYPLTFMPQRHNKFSMPHGEKGGEKGGERGIQLARAL